MVNLWNSLDKELKLCKDLAHLETENFKVKDVGQVFKTKIVLTHSFISVTVHIYVLLLLFYCTVH